MKKLIKLFVFGTLTALILCTPVSAQEKKLTLEELIAHPSTPLAARKLGALRRTG